MVKEYGGNTKWVMLTISFLSISFMYISYVGYSVATVDIMSDLSLDYTQAGALASISSLTGGISVLVAWMIIGKFGPKRVSVFAMFMCAIGLLLFAVAKNYEVLLMARAIQGIGVCLLFVSPYTLTNNWFTGSRHTGVCLGVLMAGDGAGTAVGLYLYAIVIVALGWRSGSVAGGLFLLTLAVILIFVMKDPPTTDYVKPKKGDVLKTYFSVIKQRNVIVPALFLLGLWGSYSVAVYWVPTLLMEDAGWSATLAGFVGSLFAFVGIISSIGFGLISDRLGKRKIMIIFSGMLMTIAFIISAIAVVNQMYVLLAVMLPVAGLGAYAGMPMAYALTSASVKPQNIAAAFGFIQFLALICGALVYPIVMGYIKDVTNSYAMGFIGIAVSVVLLNVVSVFFSKDVAPKTEEELQTNEK